MTNKCDTQPVKALGEHVFKSFFYLKLYQKFHSTVKGQPSVHLTLFGTELPIGNRLNFGMGKLKKEKTKDPVGGVKNNHSP